MSDEKWKSTKDGWGNVIDVNKESHITITNEKAEVGEGFHITTNTGKGSPKNRDYFDKNGNYIKSD